MPTNQPSNAPDDLNDDLRDNTSAAAALTDPQLDKTPGGGGLGGATAAETDPQGASPADAAVPQPGAADTAEMPGRAAAEARTQAPTAEPHPRAQ